MMRACLVLSLALAHVSLGVFVSEPCCSEIPHIPAEFGPDLLSLVGNGSDAKQMEVGPAPLVPVWPPDACAPLEDDINGSIALIARGFCNFTEKIMRVQAAGAVGAIVYNNILEDHWGIIMTGAPGETDLVTIPSVFISLPMGIELIDNAKSVTLNAVGHIVLHKERGMVETIFLHLFATSIVMSVTAGMYCFIVFCLSRYQRGSRRRATGSLPQRHFHPSCGCDEGVTEEGLAKHKAGCRDEAGCEMCSICLEEFKVQEKLTVLPCDHHYHPDCVLPWLAEKSGLCPLCKRDAFPPTWMSNISSFAMSYTRGTMFCVILFHITMMLLNQWLSSL